MTVLGTLIGLFLTGTYAYALSRKTYAFRSFFTKVITIPMLFSGGMIANYLVNDKSTDAQKYNLGADLAAGN